MRAIDVVRRVALRARPAYLEAFEHGDGLLGRHGITTPLRLAHFLAQILHETGGLAITQAGDGFRYRGGGIMQTTGRANYRRMGQKCGVDLEANPELVCSAAHALKPALAEWSEGNLNAAADRDDIHTITRRINGGYNGLADRQAWYRRVRPLIDTVDLEPKELPAPVPAPAPQPAPPAKPRTGWWAAL